MFCVLFACCLVVSTSAIDSLKRLVSEVIGYVSSGRLNSLYTVVHAIELTSEESTVSASVIGLLVTVTVLDDAPTVFIHISSNNYDKIEKFSSNNRSIKIIIVIITAGDPGGIRPQHIRDLLNCREAGSEFLTAP